MKEKIKVSTLPNGIRVVTQERDSGKVAFVFMVGCGARYDPEKVVGVSHALEHMMFKGTEKRSPRDIAREMENSGSDINASTGIEKTTYYFTGPASRFEQTLKVYADSLNNSLLDAEEWNKERGAVLEEKEMRDESNTKAVFQSLHEKMFNLNMGILGSRETIKNIRVEDMGDIIRKYYLPENIVISVSGGIKHRKVLKVVKRLFGDFHNSWVLNGNIPKSIPFVRSACRYTEKTGQFQQTGLVLGFPGYSMKDGRNCAARALSGILGSGMSSRLFQEVREKRGLVYHVGSDVNSFSDMGIFYAYFFSTKPVEALLVLTKELKKMQKFPVTEEELERVKFQMKSAILCRENSSSFASSNAQNLLFGNCIISESEYCAKVDAVTAEDILGVARDILNLSKATVAVTGPKSLKEEIEELMLK